MMNITDILLKGCIDSKEEFDFVKGFMTEAQTRLNAEPVPDLSNIEDALTYYDQMVSSRNVMMSLHLMLGDCINQF
jgi:hypothetical protein